MSDKIKVLYLIERLARAGTELHLLKLLRGIDRERFEPVLCVLNGEMTEQALLPSDIKVHDLEAGWNLMRPATVGVWRRLLAILREEQPDIIHSFLFVANVMGPFAARRTSVKYTVASRGRMGIEWDAGLLHRWLQSAADKRTDRILCKTQAMRDEIIEYEKASEEKVRVVPNGVDMKEFSLGSGGMSSQRKVLLESHGIPEEGPLILALGNLKPIKGHEVLVRAAPRLEQHFKNFQIVVLGEGEARSSLQEEIAGLNVGNRVHLPGKMENVRDWMSAADLFVATSHSEGMPNAVLEAMAMALPLVLSDIPGHREAAGEVAWYFESRDAEEMTEAVALALANPSRRAEHARLGQERVEKLFSLKVMQERVMQIYDELAGDTSA